MSTHDVVVVGGRVAGAGTALLLARAGLRVALVDRGRRGDDTLSTHALMRAGVMQLSRWGVLDEIVAAGTPAVRRSSFHFPDGEHLAVLIKPKAGVDALYAPRRHLLDRVLVDAAEAAGAEVRHRTRVTGLRRDADGRVVGVSAHGAESGRLELTAPLVVGADGIRSQVAQQVGARVLHQGHAAGSVLYRYVEDPGADGYEWAYGAGAGAGMIPTNAGASGVFVATTPGRMRSLRRCGAERAFDALLAAGGRDVHERVRDARPLSPLRGWSGVPGFARQAWGPGWALVGDAGYFKDPITSHGITDALRDAELLSGEVLAWLGGRSTEADALARYQATRDRLSAALAVVTESVAAYDWDDTSIRALLRQVSAAMTDEVTHLAGLPAGEAARS